MLSLNVPKQVTVYEILYNLSQDAYLFSAPEIR